MIRLTPAGKGLEMRFRGPRGCDLAPGDPIRHPGSTSSGMMPTLQGGWDSC